MSVEVASPEDLEHYFHVRRTGVAPEFRVIRNMPAPEDPRHAGRTSASPALDVDGDITAARVEPEDAAATATTAAPLGR